MMLIAQITDTHLFADEQQTSKGFPTWESLEAVLARVRSLTETPDVLMLTGDLSQDETLESYAQIRRAIAPLQIPTYWLPGNHDQQPALMSQHLSAVPFSDHKRFHSDNWTVLLLDSAVTGEVHGYLPPASLIWLEQQLATLKTDFALVALHHPPLSVGSSWMDAIGLANQNEFQTILHRFSQVRAVVFGHIHQELDCVEGGIRYLATPSTCVQFKPNSDVFAIDGDRTPGFRLLRLQANGNLDTWVERVDYVPPAIATAS
ncbi:MAG: 3',5'-cyclic-AMP phosphodiesterase [Elainellaceae cyanobacterium]